MRKGSMTGTPAGSKCRTLRVTTVRPRSSAVAAMSKSALSWPTSDSRAAPRQRRRVECGRRTVQGRCPARRPRHGQMRPTSILRRCWRAIPRSMASSGIRLGSRSRFRSADNTSVSMRNIRRQPARAATAAGRSPHHLAGWRASGLPASALVPAPCGTGAHTP